MGKQVSKEVTEEVIIAQNGQNNQARSTMSNADSYIKQDYLMLIGFAMLATIFIYLVWKKVHKCLTKKIERQAVAVAMRRRASV